MEEQKEKQVIKKSCLAFGVYETARKLSDSPARLKLLIQYLIDAELLEPAFLIAKHFFAAEDIASFSAAFAGLEDTLTRRDVERKFYTELTGRAPEQRRRREPRAKKEIFVPTENKDGKQYLTLASSGFAPEVRVVTTLEQLAETQQHLQSQSLVAFDMMKVTDTISTITLATAEQVAVLDLVTLAAPKETGNFLRELLQREDLRIVAFSFSRDAYFLCREIYLDPHLVKNVVDLAQVHTADDGKRIELSAMAEDAFEKPLSQFLRRYNWMMRPLPQELADFTALSAVAKLGVLQHLRKGESFEEKAFEYQEPDFSKEKKNTRNKRKRSTTAGKRSSKKRKPAPQGKRKNGGRRRTGRKANNGSASRSKSVRFEKKVVKNEK